MTQPIALSAPAASSIIVMMLSNKRHHSRQRAFREVAGEPFQVASAIDDFIDARLQKKDREEGGDQDLQKEDRTGGGMEIGHAGILARHVNCHSRATTLGN